MMSVYEYYIRINKNLKMLHVNKIYRDIANLSSMAHIFMSNIYPCFTFIIIIFFKLSRNLCNYYV